MTRKQRWSVRSGCHRPHPDRADTLHGHNDEPRGQRLAALIAVITGTAPTTSVRTALIVTVKAETLESEILGVGPIPTREALDLADDPRTDLYAAIRTTNGAILNFGRSRRLASPLQKLALTLRGGGFCVTPGCSGPMASMRR